MRARYYDPALGRFISQDPARDGNNWYAYCDNNPVNTTDPTGKFVSPIAIAALVVLFIIVAERIIVNDIFPKGDYCMTHLQPGEIAVAPTFYPGAFWQFSMDSNGQVHIGLYLDIDLWWDMQNAPPDRSVM
jgi:hypothetical protein